MTLEFQIPFIEKKIKTSKTSHVIKKLIHCLNMYIKFYTLYFIVLKSFVCDILLSFQKKSINCLQSVLILQQWLLYVLYRSIFLAFVKRTLAGSKPFHYPGPDLNRILGFNLQIYYFICQVPAAESMLAYSLLSSQTNWVRNSLGTSQFQRIITFF